DGHVTGVQTCALPILGSAGNDRLRYASPPSMDPALRHRLPTDTDDGMLLIISGPSGAGKTTITRAVERSIPGAVFSVSATTRPRSEERRGGEEERREW